MKKIEESSSTTMMLIEEKEELIIISNLSENPTKKPIRFLTPSLSSSDSDTAFDLPFSAFRSSSENPNPTNISTWVNNPLKNWLEWVSHMQALHEPTWRKAGIHHAVLSSTYSVKPDTDLVFGLASRWCTTTNTFVFPYAEATLTLEDVAVLGGFSVSGEPVVEKGCDAVGSGACSEPPLDCDVEIARELEKAREDLNKSSLKKVTVNSWMRVFMGSGSIAEHVAFLVLWLSRHVFRFAHDVVGKHLHALACRLARGTRVALAPSVLASLYRDLTLLKQALFLKKNKDVVVKVWSPMHLVQIWGWERFPTLRPQPNSRIEDEPRMAKWNGVMARRKNLQKGSELAEVRSAIDSGSESFIWRPYGDDERERCWQLRNVYPDKEKWVSVGPGMREDFKSFAKIVRVSELVGINCIQPYFPHRVSRQFGFDQEIPGQVVRFDKSPEIAWKNYNRAIRDEKLYIPAWSFRSGVTSRYLEWWEQSKLVQKKEKNDAVKVKDRKRKSITELLKEFPIATSSRTNKKRPAIEDFAARNMKLKAEKVVSNVVKATKSKKSRKIKKKGKQVLQENELGKIPDACMASSGAELEKETSIKKQRLEQTDGSKSPDDLRLSSCAESHEELGSTKQYFVVIDDYKIFDNCKSASSAESPGEMENDNQRLGRIDENKIPCMETRHDEGEINVPSNDEFSPHVEPQEPLLSQQAGNDDDVRSESHMEPTKVQESPNQTLDDIGKESPIQTLDDNHRLGRIDENKIPCMDTRHDEGEINVPSSDEFSPHVGPQEPLLSQLSCNDDDVRLESHMEPTKVQESPIRTLDDIGKEINYGNDVNMEPLLEPAKVCETTTKQVVAKVAVDEGRERIVGGSVDSVNKDRSEANAKLYRLEMLRRMPLETRISRLEILVARLKKERIELKSVKK